MPEEPERCARHDYVLDPREAQCPHCAREVVERMKGVAIDLSAAAVPPEVARPTPTRRPPASRRAGDTYSSRAVPGEGGIADEKVLGCLLSWVQHYGQVGGVEALEALHGCNWNARRALEWLLGTRAQGGTLRFRPVLELDADRYEWEMGAAAYVSNQSGSAFGDALILLNTRAWDVEGTIGKLIQKRRSASEAPSAPPTPAPPPRSAPPPDIEFVRFVRWCIWFPPGAIMRGLRLSGTTSYGMWQWYPRYVWGGIVMAVLWALTIVIAKGLISGWIH
jgi:hypothetical protein